LGRRLELVGGGLVRRLGGGGLVRGVVVEARGSVSWVAVGELGYSGADVARYLGVTNSCVTRFVASGIKADVDDLIRKL
jgi:predicted transcriptional regulator